MPVAAMACWLASVGAALAQPTWVQPPKTDRPPLVDGLLGDPCWSSAARTTPFVLAGGGEAAEHPTTALLCYDDYCLYVAFECAGPRPQGVRATARGDDRVGLRLYPDYEDGPSVVLELNARRVRRAERDGGAAWSGFWESAVARTPTGWTGEVRLPFASLEPEWGWPRHWLAQLWRQGPRAGERSSWVPSQDPRRGVELAVLQNLEVDWPRFRVRAVSVQVRPGETHLALRNEGLGDIAGMLIVESETPAGTRTRQVLPATLRGGQVMLFDVTHASAGAEPYRVSARLEDGAGPLWAMPAVLVVPQ